MNSAPKSTKEGMYLSVAKEFSTTPGPRDADEGEFSGNEFLERFLLPQFVAAKERGLKLLVDLDGTEGYATSFLEAAFGGLSRKFDPKTVLKVIDLKCDDEPYLRQEIKKYIEEAAR